MKAKVVKLGEYHLPQSMCDGLGHHSIREDWDGEDGEAKKAQVLSVIDGKSGDFQKFVEVGDYLQSSCVPGEKIGTTHIGAFRLRVDYAPCRDVSLVAQQIRNEMAGYWTFRKWNPRKKDVDFDEDTSAVDQRPPESCCLNCLYFFFCFYCAVADWCGYCATCCCKSFGKMGEEVIYLYSE